MPFSEIRARQRAFDAAVQDRIVAVGDGGDADRRLRALVARDVAGEFGERALHVVVLGIELKIAFDHDLGGGRHVKIDRLAFDEIDRLAADRAHDIVFAHALGHRRAAGEGERRLPADRDRNRHLGAAAVLPGGDMVADVLRAPHQDRDAVLGGHHAAIDADVLHAGGRVLGDHAAIGEDVAAAIDPVPLRHRKLVEVDVLAGDDVLLAGAVLDDARRDTALEQRAADLDQLARMRVRRQPHHHGDAAIAAEPAGEHRAAARVVLVVVLDVGEQQRRTGAGALRHPGDGAELDVPIDLGVDLAQFAGRLQRLHPVAHVAEGYGLAFDGHISPSARIVRRAARFR